MTDDFDLRCKGMKANVERCRSRFVNGQTGFCPAHGPGASERMSAMGKRGGSVKSPRRKISDLPELQTAEDAQKWLEYIGRAVLHGYMDSREANVARQVVSDWRKGHEETQTQEQIAKLERSIRNFRRKLSEEEKAAPEAEKVEA